jgi:hypothetical protein
LGTPKGLFGAEWSSYYSAGVGQSRDSDCLEQSNFAVMLAALGGESETVIVVRESHWAVGWVEWIAVHESDTVALAKADEQCGRLANYPVLDEEDWSQREWNAMCEYGRTQDCKGEWSIAGVRRYRSLQRGAVNCRRTTMAGWVNCYSGINERPWRACIRFGRMQALTPNHERNQDG